MEHCEAIAETTCGPTDGPQAILYNSVKGFRFRLPQQQPPFASVSENLGLVGQEPHVPYDIRVRHLAKMLVPWK